MTMMTHYFGLDVHADTVAIAVATGRSEPRTVATVPNTARAVFRALAKLCEPSRMLACYEAGPTGFGLQRALCERGVRCIVVAPALVPRQPGARVKTDRRDARNLARYLRSGDLEPIHVPDEETEATWGPRTSIRRREEGATRRAPEPVSVLAPARASLVGQEPLDKGACGVDPQAALRSRSG